MPIYTNIAGSDQPAPIESTPVTPGQGDLAAISKGFQQAPSEVAAQAGLVSLAGGTHVSQADAVKQMTDQGYTDATSHIPADGLTSDALHMIMNRQSILKRDDYALARSGNGGVRQFVGQMVGGLPDPINAAAWIFAPEAKVGQAFATKFAIGATVQGGVNAATSLATLPLAHSIGDDYSMSDVFTQTTLGVLLGGFGHGFSKGVAPAAALTTDQVTALERSAAYAKQHGISPDEVVSHAGAVGVHQVMPSTARGLGLKGTDAEITEQLKNPAVNKATSQKLLDQLAKDPKLKGDPEAQAIAYNDGPNAAYKWIKAGRNDSVLKQETAGYVQRLRELTGISRIDTRTPEAVPQGAQEEAAPPVTGEKTPASGSQEAGLVVARRMPDGTVRYGKPGDLHFNLLDEEDDTERAATGHVGLEEGDMGFAKPGGPFMSREEAAASIGKTGRLESVKYNEGEPGAFGKRNVVSDLPPQVQPDLLKTAIAQAGDDSKVNVEPVLKQSLDEQYGNTRGGNTFFHGTSSPIEKLSDYPAYSNSNIYGGGFYTTDAADIAAGYGKKGKGGQKTIYRVTKTGKEKLINMEATMSPDVRKVVEEQATHDDIVGMALEDDHAKTLREVYDSIRHNSSAEGMTRDDVQEIFDGFAYELGKHGYTGLQHIGGLLTNKEPHTVQIHWEPQTQGIGISKIMSVADTWGVKNPSDFDPRGVTEAIPQPGSAEHAKTPIEKPEEIQPPSAAGEKGPLASEAQKALANDTAELKAIPEGLRKEGEPETVAADNAIKQNEELHKATEAAVRCGLTRGLG